MYCDPRYYPHPQIRYPQGMQLLGWLLVVLGVVLALGLLGPILGVVLAVLLTPLALVGALLGVVFGALGAVIGGIFAVLGVLLKYAVPVALVGLGIWLLTRSNQPRLQQ